ncbi:MAG: 2OG-Fe(II) oxygenase [Candidatus Sericytochromatia bacterium]
MRADQILDRLIAHRKLWFQPHFLTRAQCRDWLTQLQFCPRERAEAEGISSNGTRRPEYARQSSLLHVSETLNLQMKTLLEPLAPALQAHFGVPLTRSEQLSFLHYAPGDQFKIHQDWADAPVYRDRQVSLILFLNDGEADLGPHYSGGRLSLFLPHPSQDPGKLLGVPVPAPAGMLLAFRSDLPHAVSPITAGERFSLVTWLAR